MARLTPTDAEQLACDLMATISKGNWGDAIASLALLNSLQAVYVMYLMTENGFSESQFLLFASLCSRHMNDDSYFDSLTGTMGALVESFIKRDEENG